MVILIRFDKILLIVVISGHLLHRAALDNTVHFWPLWPFSGILNTIQNVGYNFRGVWNLFLTFKGLDIKLTDRKQK